MLGPPSLALQLFTGDNLLEALLVEFSIFDVPHGLPPSCFHDHNITLVGGTAGCHQTLPLSSDP
jgi:hypothetical protein